MKKFQNTSRKSGCFLIVTLMPNFEWKFFRKRYLSHAFVSYRQTLVRLFPFNRKAMEMANNCRSHKIKALFSWKFRFCWLGRRRNLGEHADKEVTRSHRTALGHHSRSWAQRSGASAKTNGPQYQLNHAHRLWAGGAAHLSLIIKPYLPEGPSLPVDDLTSRMDNAWKFPPSGLIKTTPLKCFWKMQIS